MKIIFATNNLHKISEISRAIDNRHLFVGLKESGIIDDIPEEEETLEENALSKARFVFNKTGNNVFADDTGLEVEALSNQPGVHSARYAGDQRNSEDNIDKLLDELKGFTNRKARFRTIIALIISGEEYIFEGIVTGVIGRVRVGSNGFGYDPVFIPDGFRKTFAEMTLDEKNRTSHRAMAVEKLISFLDSYEIQ